MTLHRTATATSLLGLASILLLTAACSDDSAMALPSADGGSWGAADAGAWSGGDAYTSPPTGGGGGQTGPSAGTLTAGSFDDHDHPGVFDEFMTKMAKSCPEAKVDQRVKIHVIGSDGKPLVDATVKVQAAGQTLVSLQTGTDGQTLFLPRIDAPAGAPADLELVVEKSGASKTESVRLDQGPWRVALPTTGAPAKKLDVAFVVDATGSMGDEIKFLKVEIEDIVKQVEAKHPGVQISFALVVYRDQGDSYVTRSFDFDSLAGFTASLAPQSADGGGDRPEAMDEGLSAAAQLSWDTSDAARVLFLVADAPPHDAKMERTLELMDVFRKQAVRVYPLAASGVDDKAEYAMRVGAFKTLARYIFLSNDSGYGDPHADPNVPPHTPSQTNEKPCYNIEKLNTLMVRMISSELIGEKLTAAKEDVLRSVGTPVGGFCDGVPVPETKADAGGATPKMDAGVGSGG